MLSLSWSDRCIHSRNIAIFRRAGICSSMPASVIYCRTNIQRQYEDNKKAEIPSKQCSDDYKSMLLLKVPISMKEEQCQKKTKTISSPKAAPLIIECSQSPTKRIHGEFWTISVHVRPRQTASGRNSEASRPP